MKKYIYDYLIVGSGLFGSVFAQIMNENGKKCLVIDKRNHTGGNIYTKEESDIKIHWYGAHIFHTDNEEVWHYINRFAKFNNYVNSPLAYSKGRLYNLPFNMNTFNKLWNVNTPEEAKHKIQEQCSKYKNISQPANLEEQALKLCGDDIYYTFIKEYTEKQWGRDCTELPAFIIKRLPVRYTYDNNYFNDRYQGIPVGGYNVLIKGLLDGIEWRTGCNYLDDRAYFDGLADEIVYTGPIDEYFGWSLGFLEYRSLRFEQEMLPVSNYQGNAIVNYTERTVPYTRIVEHKHFEPGNGAVLSLPYTVVTREYPADYTPGSEAYYPVDNKRNRDLHAAYQDMGRCNVPHTWFAGRLGSYKYVDMGQAISSALKLSKALL